MSKSLKIAYGAISYPLSMQLKMQGFKFDKDRLKRFQKEVDAVNYLRLGSHVMTDSMVDKALAKIHKALGKHIAEYNK